MIIMIIISVSILLCYYYYYCYDNCGDHECRNDYLSKGSSCRCSFLTRNWQVLGALKPVQRQVTL